MIPKTSCLMIVDCAIKDTLKNLMCQKTGPFIMGKGKF